MTTDHLAGARVAQQTQWFACVDPTQSADRANVAGLTDGAADRSKSTGGKFSVGDARTVAIGVNPTGFTSAVFLNLTITETEGAGFVRVYPADESDFPPVQRHSNINWSENGQTLANLVLTQVGQENGVVFECGGVGRTHVVVDVMGYVPFTDTP